MTEERLIELVVRQMGEEIDAAERQELEGWAGENQANRAMLNRVTNVFVSDNGMVGFTRYDPANGYLRWAEKRAAHRVIRMRSLAAAAVLLLVGATGIFLAIRKKHSVEQAVVTPNRQQEKPIMPGRNTAILTLADDRQILLDTVGNGEIGRQATSRVVKTDSSKIAYLRTTEPHGITQLSYNTLTTPRSGQYLVQLPDGSKVWLNNASTLHYPTAFGGDDRTVELSGEAYFEIARDPGKPFIVKTRKESVEVLGTEFNIQAYAEEDGTSTTLIRGKVRVNAIDTAAVLNPDEQALVDSVGHLTVSKNVSAGDIASWRKGFFYFGHTTVAAIMRQLARWYDVDPVDQEKIHQEVTINGRFSRDLTLNEFIEFFKGSEIHLRLEGRKLLYSPK